MGVAMIARIFAIVSLAISVPVFSVPLIVLFAIFMIAALDIAF